MRPVPAVVAATLVASCGGPVLDLGRDMSNDGEAPHRYAPDGSDVGGGKPTIIAARQYGCAALTLDDTRVYWSTWGSSGVAPDPSDSAVVRSCEKNNCAATVVTYASSQPYVRDLVVDGSRIYWVGAAGGSSAIVACPILGCNGAPTVIAPNTSPIGFTVDASYLYWMGPGRGVLRCSLQGCPSSPTLIAAYDVPYSSDTPRSLAVDASRLYWIARDGNPSALGSVMAVAKDGSSAPEAVVADVHLPRQLSIDRSRLFWTDESAAGTVASCSIAECASYRTRLASRQQYPQSLAVGREAAYWLTSVDGFSSFYEGGGWIGQLVECSLAGCGEAPVVLATERGSPRAVAADATHVYWTTYSEHGESDATYDGAVKRLRRLP